MADQFGTFWGPLGALAASLRRRLVDMGDGTWAEKVVASAVGANGSAASASNPAPVEAYTPGGAYETVAASQSNQVMGATGAIGDYLDRVTVFVATAATGTVTIKDGATTWGIFPNSPGGGIGVYDIPVRCRALGAGWSITTGAGSTAVAVGKFT